MMKLVSLDVIAALAILVAGCNSGSGTEDDTSTDGDADAAGTCLDDIAWYQANAEGRAVAPGGKDANGYGLYDMLGNVVEWVEDCSHDTYAGAPADGSAWDEAACTNRIVRGGCYGSSPRAIRVSVRDSVLPSFYGACAPGVRCVLVPGLVPTPPIVVTWAPVPAGSFDMGCSAGDTECYDNELPSHPVTVPAFEMMAMEATQQQYYDVMGTSPASYFCAECSETYVMYEEAKTFCAAIGGRLPTEAEWEYAARGGTTTRYYCGDE